MNGACNCIKRTRFVGGAAVFTCPALDSERIIDRAAFEITSLASSGNTPSWRPLDQTVIGRMEISYPGIAEQIR